MTPEATVNAFIAAVTSRDLDTAGSLVADDLVYENIGFHPTSIAEVMPTINGRQAMVEFLAPMEDAEWTVHRQHQFGQVVVNERTDRFTFGGTRIDIPVVGIFEVVEGAITYWRDYFDATLMQQQFAGG